MLVDLIIMDEPTEWRSMRSRKPKVHFDDQIAQSLGPPKSSQVPEALVKPTKPTKLTAMPAAKPTTKPLQPPATASASTELSISTKLSILDPIEQLCSQTEELDIEEDPKAKRKAKAAEIAHLKGLGLDGVISVAFN